MPYPLGDINQDGVVNTFDLSLLLADWGSDTTQSDLNNDGIVNAFDLSLLLGNWGATGGEPEPDYDPRWSATPDAVVGSFSAAQSAYDDGARIIHLTGGNKGTHTWGSSRPNCFIRNVPGQLVTIDQFNSNAENVTLAGVSIARYDARFNFDGSMLYRSRLTNINSTVGGTTAADPSKPRVIWREVHMPERRWVNGNDVLQVKYGAQFELIDSYISGLDRNPGADGHSDTIQVMQGGGVQLGLKIVRSYLGRSHNASIIMSEYNTKVEVEDSFIDWRLSPGNDPGGGGLYIATYDCNWRGTTSHRLRCDITWNEASFLSGWTFEGNTLTLAGGSGEDTGGNGDINWTAGGGPANAGSTFFPSNNYGAPSANHPTPVWQEPSWWSELGL